MQFAIAEKHFTACAHSLRLHLSQVSVHQFYFIKTKKNKMNSPTIFNLLLVLHICGIAVAIGMTVANFIAYKQFWKLYAISKDQGVLAFRGVTKFNLFGMLSLFLVILTGIGMLWLIHWYFAELFWFKIKMTMVLLLFINGFTFGRINNVKLAKLISEKETPGPLPDNIEKLKRNLQIFQSTQLILFLIAIIMVVFKFT